MNAYILGVKRFRVGGGYIDYRTVPPAKAREHVNSRGRGSVPTIDSMASSPDDQQRRTVSYNVQGGKRAAGCLDSALPQLIVFNSNDSIIHRQMLQKLAAVGSIIGSQPTLHQQPTGLGTTSTGGKK